MPRVRGALRKVYGAVGIVLKGSGFYKTDPGPRPPAAARTGSRLRDAEKAKGGDPASNGRQHAERRAARAGGDETGSDSSKKEKSPDAKPAASTSS